MYNLNNIIYYTFHINKLFILYWIGLRRYLEKLSFRINIFFHIEKYYLLLIIIYILIHILN